MDIPTAIIIAVFFIYIGYKDYLLHKEHENTSKKLLSRDLQEYVSATEPAAENAKQEEDPYISIEDATIEEILKTKDKL